MTILARLNRPWLHFILLGFLLFYLQGVFFPEAKPVVGPLGEAREEALRQQWMSSVRVPPTPEQWERIVEAELDRDMLFQRAIALKLHLYDTVVYQRLLRNMRFLQMGEGMDEAELYQTALDMRLHLGDEVIKRRMIQVMEQLLLATNPPAVPSESEILAEFEQRKEELRRAPRLSIDHVYFNREREGEVEAVIEEIDAENMVPEAAREMSSPFLPGYSFRRQTPDQLARHFGSSFVQNLLDAGPEPGQWVGPVRSTYGMHYVWVSEMEAERDATLEEVRTQLLRDLESRGKQEALRDSIETMRQNYEILR
ncbi:MAG: peptidyl-prolyl cis-trans isomerase [Halieaceae bacterium]|nr:peptidyl-prolyl cis-trans isomerase [Halieaceae bacterium]